MRSSSSALALAVRAYRAADAQSWLRCRLLAFLPTAYFDDVVTQKPRYPRGVELVAVTDGQVVGLLDMSIDGAHATLECVAVHPDHQRLRVASRLFARASAEVQALGATTIDAWTREDEGANAWYASHGFVESSAYLHVYAGDLDGVISVEPGLVPVHAFFHVEDVAREPELRARFPRVHRCRQLVCTLPALDPRT